MFSDKVGSSCSTCEYSKRCSGFINNNIRIISQNIYFRLVPRVPDMLNFRFTQKMLNMIFRIGVSWSNCVSYKMTNVDTNMAQATNTTETYS